MTQIFEYLYKIIECLKSWLIQRENSVSTHIVNNVNGNNNIMHNHVYHPARAESLPGEKPDVSLRFVHPEYPALIVVNKSSVIARDIKWCVVLWNLNLPERKDPLPIPVTIFDWIRPYEESGPQDIFSEPDVMALLKTGNRLLGSATVMSPDCVHGRTYIVSIVWDEGGWFSEVENEKTGKLIIPANFLKETREAFFRELELISTLHSRIKINKN